MSTSVTCSNTVIERVPKASNHGMAASGVLLVVCRRTGIASGLTSYKDLQATDIILVEPLAKHGRRSVRRKMKLTYKIEQTSRLK